MNTAPHMAVCLEDRNTANAATNAVGSAAQRAIAKLWLTGLSTANIDAISGRELESACWGNPVNLWFLQNAPDKVYRERFKQFIHEHSRVLTRDIGTLYPINILLGEGDSNEHEWRRLWPDDSVVKLWFSKPIAVNMGPTSRIEFTASENHHEAARESIFPEVGQMLIDGARNNTLLGWKVLWIDDDWAHRSGNTERLALMQSLRHGLEKTLGLNQQKSGLDTSLSTFGSAVSGVCVTGFTPTGRLNHDLETLYPDIDIIILDAVDTPTKSKPGAEGTLNVKIRDMIREVRYFRDLGDFPIVVVVSMLRAEEMADLAVRWGADGYINKRALLLQAPLSFSQLLPMMLATRHPDQHEIRKIETRALARAVKKLLAQVLHCSESDLEATLEKPFGEGKSGAMTGLWKIKRKSLNSFVYRIIKCDLRDLVQTERERYLRHIVGRIDNHAGRIDGFLPLIVGRSGGAESGKKKMLSYQPASHGLISYTVAGSPKDITDKTLQPLTAYLASGPTLADIKHYACQLTEDILTPLHAGGATRGTTQNPFVWMKRRMAAIKGCSATFDPKMGELILTVGVPAEGITRIKWLAEIDWVSSGAEGADLIIASHLVCSVPPSRDSQHANTKFEFTLDRKNIGVEYLRRGRKRFLVTVVGLNEYLIRSAKKLYESGETCGESRPITPWLWYCYRQPPSFEHPNRRLTEGLESIRTTALRYMTGSNAHLAAAILRLKKRRPMTVVHGDLNPGNVMISQNEKLCRLIDFAFTGPGYPAFDYAKLEMVIRNWVMAPLLFDKGKVWQADDVARVANEIQAFEERLWSKGRGRLSFVPSKRPSPLAKTDMKVMVGAIQMIEVIRAHALKQGLGATGHYRDMFALCAARSCAYREFKPDRPSSAHWLLWSTIAAAVALDQ